MVEDLERLFDQHLRNEVAQRREDDQQNQQQNKFCPAVQVTGEGFEKEHGAQKPGAQRHARAKHRAQHRHSHDLARRLHVPTAQDQHAEQDKDHACSAKTRQIVQNSGRVVPGDADLKIGRDERLAPYPAYQPNRRGEKVEMEIPGHIAVEQFVEQAVHGGLEERGGAGQHDIYRGQDENAARQRPAEAGKAVGADVGKHRHFQPPEKVLRPRPAAAVECQKQQEDQHIADKHRDKPGQHGGEVDRLPPQGQGADQRAVAREVEPAQHTHGHQRAHHEGEPDHDLPGVQQLAADPVHRL